MASISAALHAGLAHQQAGRLVEAEQIYRQVLAVAPNHADALHLLGLLARLHGRLDEAADWIRRALATGVEAPSFYSNLGLVYQAQGNTPEALTCFERAVELRPNYAEGLNNLGMCYQSLRQHERALEVIERGIAVQPQMSELWINKGISLQSLRRRDEAARAYEHGIQLRPQGALGYGNYGLLLREMGRLDEARATLETAVKLDPSYATAHSNLATTFHDLRQFEQAEASYLRAIQLRPNHAKFHFNLANHYRDWFRSADAELWYRRAIEIDPQLASAYLNLAILLQNRGQLDDARVLLEHARELSPDDPLIYDNRIVNEAYRADSTPERVFALLDDWQRRFCDPLESTHRPHTNVVDIHRPLRVGFVSADFGVHPIGRLMVRVLRGLDRQQIVTVAYSNRTVVDDLTRQLRQATAEWREVADWTDEELAEHVRRDAIDILVDLSGHTAGHRLLAFARRPAPVQVTWMGFAASTGQRSIDWLLTDPFLVPPEYDRLYRERIWRLPWAGACYEMPNDAPAVNRPPCESRGYVTFGCFNNLIKITYPTLAAWGEIMRRLPTARLLIKFQGLHDRATQAVLTNRLAAAGVDLARVTLEGMSPLGDMLQRYHDVDLTLDPFPYTGGTTSLLASWMGVPVVTLVGQTLASRQTFSILSNAGVTETVTWSIDEYVECAVRLAQDPVTLARLRESLRPAMASSSFCDADRFVATLETAFRGMWRTWCESQATVR